VSPEDARQQTLRTIEEGADAIKIALEPGPGWPVLSREEVAAIVKAAHERGKPVTAHITRPDYLQLALEEGVDDSCHLPGALLSVELAQAMATRGMAMVPTLQAMTQYGGGGALSANLRLLKAAGVRIVMGNDGGYMAGLQVGLPLKEMEMMQAAGMTPAEVLIASTSAAAQICHRGDDLGSLEAGKWADILVVKGDPTADLSALAHPLLVIREGTTIRSSLP
jgi:imidazolonepropionase-like amidohydrolase